MNTAFPEIFEALDAIRRVLVEASSGSSLSPEILGPQYLGIDNQARRLLLAAARDKWNVPAAEVKQARRDLHLGHLVSLAEQYAPQSVSQELLGRITTIYHHIRNAVEHQGYQPSAREAFEYLEAVESLAYSIADPGIPSAPTGVLTGFEGYRVLGAYELIRGELNSPWYVVHGVQPVDIGPEHVLEFWRYHGDRWHRERLLDLGQQYTALVQKIKTRSSLDEELLVWRRFGESMGVMSYDVFAVEGPQILRLLGREGLSGAYVTVRGKAIEEHAGDRIIRYEWDGFGYVGCRVIRHRPAPLDVSDIHYSVVEGQVVGPAEVSFPCGQVFRVLRDDLEPEVVRTLFSANGVIELLDDGSFRTDQPGETRITLIPRVYDWKRSLEIKVSVVQISS